MSGPFLRPKATKANGVKIPHFINEPQPESIRIDNTGVYQYFGYAPMASAEADAVWKISRLAAANPQSLLWADGNADYDNAWSNRASLSFS